MISDESKLFGCPICGFRVGPEEGVCPRCGNKFTQATKFECPFCGELVEQDAEACRGCHVNYAEFRAKTENKAKDETIDSLLMEIIQMEASEVKSEAKRLSCPVCSWLLNGTERSCPKCGKSFDLDLTYQCPVCGSLVHSDAVKCSECDAMFEEGEEEVSEHEEAAVKLDELADAVEARAYVAPAIEDGHAKAEEPAKEPETAAGVQSAFEGFAKTTGQVLGSIFGTARKEPEKAEEPPPKEEPQEVRAEKSELEQALEAVDQTEAPAPSPEEMPPAKGPEPTPEPEEPETTAEPQVQKPAATKPAAPAGAPKKTKQRKLKAKPQGAKPKQS